MRKFQLLLLLLYIYIFFNYYYYYCDYYYYFEDFLCKELQEYLQNNAIVLDENRKNTFVSEVV